MSSGLTKDHKKFTKEWGIRHATSSPIYPQSNRKAESAIKSMKKIIEGSWEGHQLNQNQFTRGLLQYRNIPSRRDGISPAQKLFGKSIQDMLPAHPSSFNPCEPTKDTQKDDIASQQYYNQRTHPLSDIHVGSNVAIQNPTTKRWDIYGTVVHIGPYGQHHIKPSNGRVLTRNCRFIRRCIPVTPWAPSTPQLPSSNPLPQTPTLRRSSRTRRRPIRYTDEFASKSTLGDAKGEM